jgi:tetratricopeptide (TPR) repeat protein
MSIVLIAFPLYSLANHEISNKESDLFFRAASDREALAVNFKQSDPKPDIYYIIMDAYLRDDVMNEFWGFDNSEFNKFLTNRGFYVAPKSRSNYPRTIYSLASSLNMEYIPRDLGGDSNHEHNKIPLIDAIEKNRVVSFLKSIGYLYVHLSVDTNYTNRPGQADIVISNRKYISYFSQYLLNKTIFKSLKSHSLGVVQTKRNNILYGFNKLEEIPKIDEPTFTFAHFIMPHGPQAFDENGDIPIQNKNESKNYFGELLYANKKIKYLVDHILANSKIPPIILIQGDHGYPRMKTSFPNAEKIKKRYSNLSAYYLPGQGEDKLYETITPVNSFRLIFDHYFGTQLGLLEDKSYLPITYNKMAKAISLPSEDSLNNNGITALVNNLEQIVLKEPDFAEAHGQLGKYYTLLKRYPEAIASLKKSIRLDSDLIWTHIHLAEAYFLIKNHTKALDIIRRVIGVGLEVDLAHENIANSQMPYAYSVLGNMQSASGHYREALSSFKEALKIYPNHLGAIYGVARAYAFLKDKEKSLSYFRKAVLISPSHNTHNNLGFAYTSFNHLDEGIKEFNKALAINPNFAEAHYNLGHTHIKKKNYQQGINYYKKAIEQRPGYLKAYFNLGVTYEFLNNPLKAIEYYQKIVTQKPDHMLAHFGLGNAYLKSNQIKAALLEYQRALILNPDHIPSYVSLGNIQLFHLRQIDQARKTYEVAILKQPKNAEIHRNLGLIYSQMNKDPDKTMFHFQESIRLAPKQPGSKKIYSMIEGLKRQGQKSS